MESHPNFHDYGRFSDHNLPQNGSACDDLHNGDVLDRWGLEDFHYEPGLDVNYFQPGLVSESENGIAQLSFTTDFASSQSSSQTAFVYAGNNHANSILVPHEATEAHNWLPTSDANAVYPNFRQEIDDSVSIPKSPRATALVPSYNVRPPQIISPSITFQPLCSEPVEPLVYAPQQGFEPLPDGESGENSLYNNSLYAPPTPFLK